MCGNFRYCGWPRSSKTAGVASRRSLIHLATRFIVRSVGHHLVDRRLVGRRLVGRRLVGRHHRLVSRAVGVHVPVFHDLLVVGRLAARDRQICLARLDSVVLAYYLSLLCY